MDFDDAVVHHTSFQQTASELEDVQPLRLWNMLRYAITDGTNPAAAAERWAAAGVDFVQVRAKELDAGSLLERVAEVRARIQHAFSTYGRTPKLLVNGRVDVAIAAGADGVHLTASLDEFTPEQVRQVFAGAGVPTPVVSVSTHTVAQVQRAADAKADLILFGPVFEKRVNDVVVVGGIGFDALREACSAAGATPLLALGGVTLANASACVAAGAAGIASIRLFA